MADEISNEQKQKILKKVFTHKLKKEKTKGLGNPQSTFEGQAADAIRKTNKILGLKGGGRADRGLGKAFMKGGKVK